MANKLDPMDLKQIIQLHEDGSSNRNTAKVLGISRNTVNNYMRMFKASEYSMAELLNFDSATLNKLFPGHTTIQNERYDELMQFFEGVNKARKHPGFTFLYHYKQYYSQAEDPYSYTQFMEHFRRKYAKSKGSMKLTHNPGEAAFIDFAGKKLHITDRKTGELIPVEVFVAILPSSQYTYVEACLSQQRKDLICCCINMLEYFGGIPMSITSDNLKSAVSRASKYEPAINRTFKEFALHYGCAINPARAYSPQDKALVENAVHLTYQRIYHLLRDMTFFSLEELNEEIRRLLVSYNDQLFQRKEGSRRERFQSVEREYLKPLPQTRYELKDYTRAKVQKMGYIYFSPEKSYYSVPHRFIGCKTQIHYTRTMVEVYYNSERIALHPRNPQKGHYNTIKEHLSSAHKAYSDWSPEYFKKLASRHGAYVISCIEKIIDKAAYPEIGYKSSMGVIRLSDKYGSERLNNACKRAIETEALSYVHIGNILKNNMDSMPTLFDEQVDTGQTHIPKHANIRGPEHYT